MTGAVSVPTIIWHDRDPARLVAVLDALGLPAAAGGAITLPSARIVVALTVGAIDGLAAPAPDALPMPADVWSPASAGAPVDVVAIGWATVDLERAAASTPGLSLAPAADEPLLGARVWVDRARVPIVAVLEPATEGRLAASLARHGEGPVAVVLRVPPSATPRHPPVVLSSARLGPFGDARLVLFGPPYGPTFGPYLVLVDGPPPGGP